MARDGVQPHRSVKFTALSCPLGRQQELPMSDHLTCEQYAPPSLLLAPTLGPLVIPLTLFIILRG